MIIIYSEQLVSFSLSYKILSWNFFRLNKLRKLAHIYGLLGSFWRNSLRKYWYNLSREKTITIVGGFLAGSGELDYKFVLLVTILGAVAGDSCGYLIGRIGGWDLFLKITNFFRLPEAKVQLAKIKFVENAAQAVFFGRFITLLRIFAGPIAGIVKMPYTKFLFYNFLGATVWGSVIVTVAYFAGRFVSLTQLVNLVGQFGFIALILIIAWIVIPWVWHSSRKKNIL